MNRREHLRRAVHVGLGALAFALPTLGFEWAALACFVAVLVNGFLVPRWSATRALLRDDGGVVGIVLYPLVLLVSLLIFRQDLVPTQAAWLALAFGDGLAPYVGQLLPRPRWRRSSPKSIPASLVAHGLACALMLTVMAWPTAVIAALLAALADGLLPGDDNLTIPVAAASGVLLSRVFL